LGVDFYYEVNSQVLKFLYYGELRGWLHQDDLSALRRSFTDSSQIDPAVKEVMEHLFNKHVNSHYLSDIQDAIQNYHYTYSRRLYPNFWNRSQAPFLSSFSGLYFGDTYLELAKQTSNTPQHTWDYLLQAFSLQNKRPQFQNKLSQQFLDFIRLQDKGEFSLLDSETIQSHLIKLGKTALENADLQLEIGKSYLDYRVYEETASFLTVLKQHFSDQAAVLEQIGHAYWHLNHFDQAVECYSKTIELYQSLNKQSNYSSKIAGLNKQIGMAHLEKKIKEANPDQALFHFYAALHLVPKDTIISALICRAYQQASDVNKNQFESVYGESFKKFIGEKSSVFFNQEKEKIQPLLSLCIEQALSKVHRQDAADYANQAQKAYVKDQAFQNRILLSFIRLNEHQTCSALLPVWSQQCISHPEFKENLGHAYWQNGQKAEGIQHYQQAKDLYAALMSRTKVASEMDSYKKGAARNFFALGQCYLNLIQEQNSASFVKKLFSSKVLSKDDIVACWENAYQLDPKKDYQTALFNLCIELGNQENQKYWPHFEAAKVISYYRKAYTAQPENGEYLSRLIELELKEKKTELISLFETIQKQPWAPELKLRADIYFNLASFLIEKERPVLALDCLDQACQLEPSNAHCTAFMQLSALYSKQLIKAAAKKSEWKEKTPLFEQVEKYLLKGVQYSETASKNKTIFSSLSEQSYKENAVILSYLYTLYAREYTRQFEMPYSMNSKEIVLHQKEKQKEIDLALDYYTKAIQHNPEKAELHFEKGLILDFRQEDNQALEAYRLAIKNNKTNPFYRKRLALLYKACYVETQKEEFNQKAEEHSNKLEPSNWTNFNLDYALWQRELFCRNKTSTINPHTYQ
jgi:tetratricopeptide (TPR) repeat protein